MKWPRALTHDRLAAHLNAPSTPLFVAASHAACRWLAFSTTRTLHDHQPPRPVSRTQPPPRDLPPASNNAPFGHGPGYLPTKKAVDAKKEAFGGRVRGSDAAGVSDGVGRLGGGGGGGRGCAVEGVGGGQGGYDLKGGGGWSGEEVERAEMLSSAVEEFSVAIGEFSEVSRAWLEEVRSKGVLCCGVYFFAKARLK